jgi:hypothetical protein
VTRQTTVDVKEIEDMIDELSLNEVRLETMSDSDYLINIWRDIDDNKVIMIQGVSSKVVVIREQKIT